MQTLVGLFHLNQEKTFDHCYEEKLVQILVDCFGFKQKQPTYLKMFDVFFGLHWNFDWNFAVNLAYPLKLRLKVCSQTFIPPWKFALKVSIKLSCPLEILQWKFQWNFQPNLNYYCSQNAGLKVSVETFKLKLSRAPETFTETFNVNFQGGMKVWLQTFNQSFRGVWKFDCKLSIKLSIKLSYHIEIGIVFPQTKKVEFLVQTHLHPFGQLPFFLMDEVFSGFD